MAIRYPLVLNPNLGTVEELAEGDSLNLEGSSIAQAVDISISGNVVANTVTALDLSVTGTTSLGSINNIVITGGRGGQVATTDGSGNLRWTTIAGVTGGNAITGAQSDVTIYDDGYVGVTINDVANVALFNNDGISLVGTLTTNNISADGLVELGNVDNLRIRGGNASQFLQTDGNGFVTWATVKSDSISNGDSNVTVYSNLVTMSSNGVANTLVVDGDRVSVDGTLQVNVNTYLSNLIANGSEVSLGNIANLHIYGGNADQFLQTDGTGTLVWATVKSDRISNGSSNVVVDSAGGNVTVGINDTANIAVIHEGGLYLDGYLETTSRVYPESVEFANIANLVIPGGADGQYLKTDGAGNLAWGTVSTESISNANSNVTVQANSVTMSANGQADIFVVSSNGTSATTTIADHVTITGNLTVQGNMSYINTTNQFITDPIIDYGVGANNLSLTSNDGQDRGVALHTYGVGFTKTTVDTTSTGATTMVLNNVANIVVGMEIGYNDHIPHGTTIANIWSGNSTVQLSSATTKSINGGSTVTIGKDLIRFMGWDVSEDRFVIAANAWVGTDNIVTYNSYGNIRMGNVVADRFIIANSTPVANINNVMTSDANGAVVWSSLDRGTY
jgi:hypothetical protein